ncbi:MAG TPA: ATP-dependent protease ATPase subunit HslU [Armatimonadota bacterium]|nr:ATP-dependent protease ATPase subunit HslU [Armatimonadota bacterium]
MEELTPRQIVAELDKYIVGQAAAKRAVAIALRNRYRRRLLPLPMRDEVIPKNILMIGPTGVGKTEIARRLARLANAPFTKVEATKFTEVGYVGRDVDSMVRDLVQVAYQMIESEKTGEVRERAAEAAEGRLLDLLHSMPQRESYQPNLFMGFGGERPVTTPEEEERQKKRVEQAERIRARLKEQLAMGALDDRKVEVELEDGAGMTFTPVFSNQGMEEMGFNLQDVFGNMMQGRKRTRTVTVAEARELLTQEEARKLIDQDAVKREAVERAEQDGIIFVDEMDKIAGKDGGTGPDVSRGGVQRDILPIIEGSTIQTKYGPVRTDHVLFIAAGAFHVSKPSDLIPELQGRLPIRVELDSLTEGDFRRILTEPENALTKQYTALLGTDDVDLVFTDDGIDALARIAAEVNQRTENIGARRLHTVMERMLEDVSFDAPENASGALNVDAAYVQSKLDTIAGDQDLSRYIL